MSYKVKALRIFEKRARKLAKKYPSLKADLLALISTLKKQPLQGISLGNNCFKIRMAISSKSKGKSGGARVITNLAVRDNTVYMLTIYDKSEKVTITDSELKELIRELPY